MYRERTAPKSGPSALHPGGFSDGSMLPTDPHLADTPALNTIWVWAGRIADLVAHRSFAEPAGDGSRLALAGRQRHGIIATGFLQEDEDGAEATDNFLYMREASGAVEDGLERTRNLRRIIRGGCRRRMTKASKYGEFHADSPVEKTKLS